MGNNQEAKYRKTRLLEFPNWILYSSYVILIFTHCKSSSQYEYFLFGLPLARVVFDLDLTPKMALLLRIAQMLKRSAIKILQNTDAKKLFLTHFYDYTNANLTVKIFDN